MRKLLIFLTSLFIATGSAGAVTFLPGNVYEGTYSFSTAGPSSSNHLPILSIDSPFYMQQYYGFFGTSGQGPGTTLHTTLLEDAIAGPPGPEMASDVVNNSLSSKYGNIGFGPSYAGVVTSGRVQVTVTGGPIELDWLQVAGSADVTVELNSGAPLATGLLFVADVENWQLVPPDPQPTPVPLPATAVLLGGALVALLGLRRRKFEIS
ncbi:hypothetical protein ACFMPD_06835 [Sedimentitalea sp. HM32M-2]|uniref:hypothetical protein n=1 Tax=Sedimentitalea sp. HM32M-2 TaxID=3351566 RepID=UPI00363F2BEF